jgi:hypothetical protein
MIDHHGSARRILDRELPGAWRCGAGGVQVLDDLLAERIRVIAREAPSFAAAWRRLEESGIPVLVGSREQLAEVLPHEVRRVHGWAGITLVWGARRPERAVVAIRVEWLREIHDSFGNPEEVFLEALDRLVIHEVYGRLLPTVEANAARTHCPDPAPGEWQAESCEGRREAALWSERRERVAAGLALGTPGAEWDPLS